MEPDIDFDAMYGGRFLGAQDISGRVVAEFAEVRIENLRGKDNTSRPKRVITFEGVSKALPINKTNAMALAAAFGKSAQSWVGKSVGIFTEPTVFGPGVRVKPLPNQSQPVPVEPDFDGEDIPF